MSDLPALALPPIGGLVLLLFGYIALIGPINYLVLKRLDKREWAWVTMPALIGVFAVGAYAYGSALRGSDVIVNEVAIVRGAPDATEGAAQVYLGVFSPTRGTYQVALPGGALLSAPVNGDFFGGQGTVLDVVQGDTARVRNLSVGFGSLRTVRAETPAEVPLVHADLQLVNGVVTGTIRNDSTKVLEAPAVVLGGSVVVLSDIEPGATAKVTLRVSSNLFGTALSDKIVGQVFFSEQVASNEAPAPQPDPSPDHRPADVRPDVRQPRLASTRTSPCCSPGAVTRSSTSRSKVSARPGPRTSSTTSRSR